MEKFLNPWLLLGALGAALLCGWYGYTKGSEHGRQACEAEHSAKAAEAQTAIDLRDQTAADARVDMIDLLHVELPKIEATTHETTERIRIVYKTRVVPGACAAAIERPISVQKDLDAARERANSAASGLRLGTTEPDPTDTRMAGNRPMGSDHDGALRGSSYPLARLESMPR